MENLHKKAFFPPHLMWDCCGWGRAVPHRFSVDHRWQHTTKMYNEKSKYHLYLLTPSKPEKCIHDFFPLTQHPFTFRIYNEIGRTQKWYYARWNNGGALSRILDFPCCNRMNVWVIPRSDVTELTKIKRWNKNEAHNPEFIYHIHKYANKSKTYVSPACILLLIRALYSDRRCRSPFLIRFHHTLPSHRSQYTMNYSSFSYIICLTTCTVYACEYKYALHRNVRRVRAFHFR